MCGCSPSAGADRKVAGGEPQQRSAAASCRGGASVHLRRRGAAERVRLGEGMLEATSVCSDSTSGRRIERREAIAADGLALQAMAALRQLACDGEMFVRRGTASRSS
jgi:hypothetical protein